MKLKILSVLALAMIPVFALVATASAQTFRSSENVTVESRESIDGSAWIAGNDVNIAGEINGDLFCAGQNVTVSGTVYGDVLCSGQTVKITGAVAGDVRTAGQSVSINSNIGGSVTAMGQTVALEMDSVVSRDVSLTGQNLRIDGQVGRDALLVGTTAVVASEIGGDINATVDDMSLADSADVSGNIVYTSPREFVRADGAVVSGNVTYNEAKKNDVVTPALSISFAVLVALMMLFSALALAILFPRALHRTTEAGVQSFPQTLLALGVGLIAGIVMPFMLLLLVVTVVGIPLAIILGIAWMLVVLLSGAVSAYYLGRVLWRKQGNAIVTMLFGAILLILLLLLPIINILVYLFAVWYGIGAILLQFKRTYSTPSYNMQAVSANEAPASGAKTKKKKK